MLRIFSSLVLTIVLSFILQSSIHPQETQYSGPGPATNPNPANGSVNIPVTYPHLTWENPIGTSSNQLFLGTSPGSLTIVQNSTPPSTSFNISMVGLQYNTSYFWRVDEIDASGTTTGQVWSFSTEFEPHLWALFYDDFEDGLSKWVITNNGGDCDWQTFSPPYPNTYTLPFQSTGTVFAADADECGNGTSLLSTATIKHPMNTMWHSGILLEFLSDWNAFGFGDSAFVELSADSITWIKVLVLDSADVRNQYYLIDISDFNNLPEVWLRFVSVQPGWDWWWVIDNVIVFGNLPVELNSFTAQINNHDVILNWQTATEKNNRGFEIEKRTPPLNPLHGGEEESWTMVGFVEGYGTTTEAKKYSFTDTKVPAGKHIYRLKQIDFVGAFEYSSEVEVDIDVPKVFSLEQNYPNPFNPSTKINYNLPSDAKVTLKVFDVLGQEVKTLLNNTINAGSHEVTFDASNLNSGVYFYTINAKGMDGTNFISTKKMILTR